MGTPGTPWTVPREQIEQALKKQKGRLTYACKDLNCTYRALKKYIDEHPDLQEELVRLRNEFDCTLLDMAESSLIRGMSESDPNAYLKSAFYVLNNKGRERGYSGIEEKQMSALSGLQQYWKDHEIKPEMMERFEAYCKTIKSEADAEPKPGDKAD